MDKDDGDSFLREGEELGGWERVKSTVEFTVHRGAAEVLGSEG